MNYSDLSSLLILIGILILVYPLTVIFFQFYDSPMWFFKVTLGIGSALFGAGIGFGVGHIVYRKEKGEKNDDKQK